MSTVSETSKIGRIPPPIATDIARDLSDYKTASPILREFDRYPLTSGRVEQQRSSVSSIMNTVRKSEATPEGLFKLHAANDSITSNGLDKRLGKKLNKGHIQISSPEGFKHISGSGSQHFEEAILQRTDSSNGISGNNRSPPPVPKPPSTKGPPVKSYRESMALRGVSPVIDPSAGFGHESRFSRALNSSQTHLQQQHKQTVSLPSPVMSQRDSRRISRFPWKRPGERPDSPNSSFQISEPVLEYSTTELIHTTPPPSTVKSNSISTDVYSPTPELDTNSSHAHTPTSSRSSSVSVQPMMPKVTSQHISQRQLASSPVLQSPPHSEAKPSPEYDYTHARQVSSRSNNSLEGPVNEANHSSENSFAKPTVQSTNGDQLYHSDIAYSAEAPKHIGPTPVNNSEIVGDPRSNSEVLKWRQKCRESEEKRRALIVDYQQKLDAERKKNVDLEKKVEMMVREKAATAATFVTHTTSPKTIDLTNKVKALESQRRALKEALQNVRETKDLEIEEYRRLLIKLKGRSQRQGDDPSNGRESPTPSTTNLKKNQEFRPIRVGISPFLPTSLPVNFSQASRDSAKR